MSTATLTRTQSTTRPSFAALLHSEWLKLSSVRSTGWNLAAMVVLGAGLTTLICWGNAEWLASPEADESPGSFITWGMMIAQISAVVLGALAVTTEYGTGMIRTSFAAAPRRTHVFFAKAAVITGLLFVVGLVTALLGYVGGNFFLDREGIGLSLEGDVLRAMYGAGLYMAGLGLFAAAAGFVLRHTAATISIVIGLVFVVGNMVMLVPGDFGIWLERLMPGNAGGAIAAPVPFNPNLLDTWPSFGIFAAEVAAMCLLAVAMIRRRDA